MSERRPNERVRDDLDQMLDRWSKRRAAGRDRLQRLEDRISTAVGRESFGARDEAAIERRHAARWRNVSFVSLAAAAALLIALFAVWFHWDNPSAAPDPAGFARISDDDVARKQLLFAEMERVFDNRVVWIVESADDDQQTDDDIQMGLVQDSPPGAQSARPLVIRLTVVRRTANDRRWKPVQVTDVISRNEQLVQLSPRGKNLPQMSVWAYVLPDKMIAVDTELALEGRGTLEANSSSLQESGVPWKVFSARDGDAEYEVYQTVRFLDDEVG